MKSEIYKILFRHSYYYTFFLSEFDVTMNQHEILINFIRIKPLLYFHSFKKNSLIELLLFLKAEEFFVG